MNAPLLDVKFYKTPAGNEPVREWLREEVKQEDRKIIGEDIKTVQYGWPVGMPLVEKFQPELLAVRTVLPMGRIARVFFTMEGHLLI